MSKLLKFVKSPKLSDLEGLKINDNRFVIGTGLFVKDGIIMEIPEAFRFRTRLEVATAQSGGQYLILSQLLTGGPNAWDMEDAFYRIGFRNPEIETQLRALCDELVSRGLAEWVDE
jgi:hypothetical protein